MGETQRAASSHQPAAPWLCVGLPLWLLLRFLSKEHRSQFVALSLHGLKLELECLSSNSSMGSFVFH